MKVIFVTSDFPPGKGGISTLSKNLALLLNKVVDEFEVHILFSRKQIEELDKNFNFPIFCSETRSLFGNFVYVLKLCFKNRFSDTIYQTPNLFPLGLFIVVGKCLFGGFALVHAHGTDFLSKLAKFYVRLLKKITLYLTDRVIFISASTKREVLKQVNLREAKMAVIYCPMFDSPVISKVEREKARAKLKLKPNDFVLISVGNLVYRKGNHLIIQALKNLSENLKLFIVGSGPEKDNLKKLIQDLNLQNRATLCGRVPNTEIYYNSADLFIMASFYDQKEGDIEGLGIVILEAEAKGLPVIVAQSGGMPEAIKVTETGLIFAEKDFKDLTVKVLQIYNDKTLQEKFKKNGPAFVQTKFKAEKITSQYLRIYQDLFEKNGKN